MAASCASIRRFSAEDAKRYPDYERFLDQMARCIEPLLDAPPPVAYPAVSTDRVQSAR